MGRHGILSFHAHPDDETLFTGGTLAECAKQGLPVTVVFATRGEEGNRGGSQTIGSQEALGAEREGEARAALAILGTRDVEFLGYRDSGLSPATWSNPSCFAAAQFMEATGRLVDLIRARKPRVVIAYDPFGGYGHVDHVQVHRVGTAAYFGSADPERFPVSGGLEPWQASSLYWATTPRSQYQFPGGHSPQPLGSLPEQISVDRDVSAFVEVKQAALAEHKTQFGPDEGGLAALERAIPLDREYFMLAHSMDPADVDDLEALTAGRMT